MNQAAAGRVVTYLNAAFVHDALEPESFAVFVKDIALLADAAVAMEAAQELARTAKRFPVLREFREVYRMVAEQKLLYEREKRPALPEPKRTGIPEWVQCWWFARRVKRDWRPFPQQEEWADPFTVMSAAEYTDLHREWVEAGSPRIRSVNQLSGLVESAA